MTRYQVWVPPGEDKIRSGQSTHDEITWDINRDSQTLEVVLTKIIRTWPMSGRGVERKRVTPKVKQESMRIPRREFSGLIKVMIDLMMQEIEMLEEDPSC